MLAARVILCVVSSPVLADERPYKIEAAYLYSFFNYITWPNYASPQALVKPAICVYGDDPIIPYLDYIRDKMASERTLNVRSITESNDTAGCNIFFIRHRMPRHILASLPASTLTVFKPDDQLDRGGMIQLSEDEERLMIKIDQSRLEKNGFHVSSRLLSLAQLIR